MMLPSSKFPTTRRLLSIDPIIAASDTEAPGVSLRTVCSHFDRK